MSTNNPSDLSKEELIKLVLEQQKKLDSMKDIVFTKKEAERYEELKCLLKQSVSAPEAEYYSAELDSLLAKGRLRARQK